MHAKPSHTPQAAGLTHAEAQRRLKAHGPNTLVKKKRVHPIALFFRQFADFLTIILLMSTGLSLILGEHTEAVTILAIVVLNALLGFLQEYRTEKTIEALKGMAAPKARALRDGHLEEIPAADLVPGDRIALEQGDRVPADATLLEGYGLRVDESLLTGESVPVEKSAGGPEEAQGLYMGTLITQGRASALVTATGMETQMGRIAGMLGEIEEPKTPLQIRLDQLGKYIAIGCLVICGIVSVTGILRGEDVLDMVVMGISLSVAAVPEGLSAIVTIALALAVGRMVRRKALVRKLHAVETLGCSSVICTDKTGTLTENRMTVRAASTLERRFAVTGSGLERKGDFLEAGKPIAPRQDGALWTALEAACLCNNAEAEEESVRGDPTEIALLLAGIKAGQTSEALDAAWTLVDELPFDSDRKLMSVRVRGKAGERLYTKGAPDVLLGRCTKVWTAAGVRDLTQADRDAILRENERMGADALRVLGTAYKERPSNTRDEQGLTFLALLGMIDPPRQASYEAVRQCRRAGIRPIMITGDHKVTAQAVAKDLTIYQPGDRVLTGAELDAMSEEALTQAVKTTTVFARVSPRHKLQIVRAFRKLGHVVAMTGDGVNDAPAIKEADIGVAMGVTGTDVAKEAAGVILMDDNFATLVAAVEEGRVIYRNIRKFIRYLLSCNVGEVMTMFLGMLMGFPVVLLPIQILWINLVTDGLPAIALGMDPPEGDVMLDPPRGTGEGVFAHGLLQRIFVRGMMIAFCTLLVFFLFLGGRAHLDVARTGAFLTLVLTQLIHVFECKSERKRLTQIPLGNNPWLIAAVLTSLAMILAVIYVPFLQPVFQTVALSGQQLLTVLGISLLGPLLSGLFQRNPAPAPLERPDGAVRVSGKR